MLPERTQQRVIEEAEQSNVLRFNDNGIQRLLLSYDSDRFLQFGIVDEHNNFKTEQRFLARYKVDSVENIGLRDLPEELLETSCIL
tara:strand:- start:5023 stop:5280 length:258 start_codon:yes stop_codon:yes gene_type:complete